MTASQVELASGAPVSDCQGLPKGNCGGFPLPFPCPFHLLPAPPLPPLFLGGPQWLKSKDRVESRDAEGGEGVSKWGHHKCIVLDGGGVGGEGSSPGG